MFDRISYRFIGSVDVPGVSGAASDLIPFGVDGVAFRTSENQLFLIRSSLLSYPLLALTLDPPVVVGGRMSTGRVFLSTSFGQGPLMLSSSNPAVVTVPPNVMVDRPRYPDPSSFPVITHPVAAPTDVVITARFTGLEHQVTVRVVPSGLAALEVQAFVLVGDTAGTGAVTLSDPAPPGGAVVTLSSSNAEIASVPGTVTVSAGATTATFPIMSRPVLDQTAAVLTAAYNDVALTAIAPVVPPPLRSFTVKPDIIRGGETATGTLTLGGPAPESGYTALLSAYNSPLVKLPAAVTVPAGGTSVSFPVATSPVMTPVDIGLSASADLDEDQEGARLRVVPGGIVSFTLQSSSVVGGAGAMGTITIAMPAPPAGALVTLASSDPNAAAVPAAVTVPAGATTTTFAITTRPVAKSVKVVLSAANGGLTLTATLQVRQPALVSLTLAPVAVRGGEPGSGTVTLASPAPEGGLPVTLSAVIPDIVKPPALVTVSSGATSATFPITTRPVPGAALVPITATSGESLTAALWVLPAGASITPALGLSFASPSVRGGQSTTGVIVLSDPLPLGEVAVTLASANPAIAVVPVAVLVPAGAGTVTFLVKTSAVRERKAVLVVATYGGMVATNILTIDP